MDDPIVCWNCAAVVAAGAPECPFCFAGLDPAARGIPAEAAEAEQLILRAGIQSPLQPDPIQGPRRRLEWLIVAMLILVAFGVSVVASFAMFLWALPGPCEPDEICDSVGAFPLVLILILWPLLAALFIGLASRRRQRLVEQWQSQGPSRP